MTKRKAAIHKYTVYSLADRIAMFEYFFVNNQKTQLVCKHFGASRATVTTIRKEDDWDGQIEKRRQYAFAAATKKWAAENLKTLAIAKEMLGKEFEAYSKRAVVTGNISDIVTLINLINRMEGVGEGEGNHPTGVGTIISQHFANCNVELGSAAFEQGRANLGVGLDRLRKIRPDNLAPFRISSN